MRFSEGRQRYAPAGNVDLYSGDGRNGARGREEGSDVRVDFTAEILRAIELRTVHGDARINVTSRMSRTFGTLAVPLDIKRAAAYITVYGLQGNGCVFNRIVPLSF